tara:strand:+ start:933 stop:1346 length:414 start_codon:yes stop_codon:yes gene_type:complete
MKKNDQAYSSWGADDLRYFRNKLNLTQAQMGEKLGLMPRMYRYYEGGQSPISKIMEYAVRYFAGKGEKSQISTKLSKELQELSKFDRERMTKLRDVIEKTVQSSPDDSLEGQKGYIFRILNQTLKEFDIVLSKKNFT